MSQESKNQETKATYESELKALKEKWALARKAERKEKAINAKQEKREKSCEFVKQALEALGNVDPAFSRELAPVAKRLNMFIRGEQYTRSNKGDNE